MNKAYFATAFVIAVIFGTTMTVTELSKVFGDVRNGYEYSENSYQEQQSNENTQYDYGNDDYNNNGYAYEYKKEYETQYYPDNGNGTVYLAKIRGDNVRPEPTDSPIIGFGKFIVEEKPSNGETQIRYVISAFDVPQGEDIIATHLHVVNNEQNQTGPHIITLCGSPANEVECSEGPGVIAAGAALQRDIEDDQTFITTMDQLVEALQQGLGYVQIHTSTIPEGAARGDLVDKGNDNNYEY
jgi:hypothetical protein